jgi:hypothetical protein
VRQGPPGVFSRDASSHGNEIYTARWQYLLTPDACIEEPDLSEEFALSGELEFW